MILAENALRFVSVREKPRSITPNVDFVIFFQFVLRILWWKNLSGVTEVLKFSSKSMLLPPPCTVICVLSPFERHSELTFENFVIFTQQHSRREIHIFSLLLILSHSRANRMMRGTRSTSMVVHLKNRNKNISR